MSKIIKNTTAAIVDIPDVGISIPASGQTTINTTDFDDLAASNDVILLVGNGTLVVNNGSEDLSKSDAIRLLQGGFTNRVLLDDGLIDSNRVKVDVTGTLQDGRTKVSSTDTTTGFLSDKITSASNKLSASIANAGNDEELLLDIVPANIGTNELNNNANFINSSQAPVQPSDISNFETSTQLDARDTNNRNRTNHTGTQTASTISDFTSAVQAAETTTSLSLNPLTDILTFTNEDGIAQTIDLGSYKDDTNLSRIISGTLNSSTGIVTFTRDDNTTFTIDFSSLNDQAAINTAISNHEQTINNHNDVNAAGAAAGEVLTYNGSQWTPQPAGSGGTQFKDFVSSTTPAGTQTTSYQQYLRLSTTIPETGNYKISWNYEWSLNTTGSDFLARIQVDDTTTLGEHQEEPQDSAGTGQVVTNLTGGTFNTGTNQRRGESGFEIVNLSAGGHSIDLDLANSTADTEATIYRACLTIERWN